jgi:hypothetical protein
MEKMSTIVKWQSFAPGPTGFYSRIGSICAQMGEPVYAAGAADSRRDMAGNQGKNSSTKVTRRRTPASCKPTNSLP